jgi:hypothetical protein
MKTQITSILIPTDFSQLSESALKMGISIAKKQNLKELYFQSGSYPEHWKNTFMPDQ